MFNHSYNNPYDPQKNYREELYGQLMQGGLGAPQPDGPEQKPRKKRRVARSIAAVAAVVMVSATAGGTAAWVVLHNNGAATPQAAPAAVVQQAPATTVPAAQIGSVTAVVQAAAGSVVEINTTMQVQGNPFFGKTEGEGAGSGVIISENGYIVTNNHVVEDATGITVRTEDGTEYQATLIGTDEKTDLAVIKVEGTGFQAAVFADSDRVLVGDLAVAIGNPLGELGGTVTNGIISATGREITIGGETMTLLQTSAAVNSGNSGGGLFDGSGHLVGIVNAKTAGVGVEGLAFAIPSNTVREVADQLIASGYVSGRPKIGISVVEINDAQTAAMYGVNKAGVYVADPGSNQNLQQGDRIVFIDGEVIESNSDITATLKQRAVGDTINVTVERQGRETKIEVILQEQVPDTVKDLGNRLEN